LASPAGKERTTVSRILVRVGLAWCALVVTIGGAVAIAEVAGAQTRATVEGALTLSAITLFPGIVCLVLSWVFSPPREDDAANRD
jgi:hypothetical protein